MASRSRLAGFIILAVGLAATEITLAVQEPSPKPAADGAPQFADMKRELEASEAALSKQLAANPKQVNLLSRRGDARFFLGRFELAVADYDAMVQLDPELDMSHWRRGIALFYAGDYQRAARQFEVYHSFDNVDRENGIWRYLSQHKALGRDKARAGLLKYAKDDREPFPDVYRLFAGEVEGSAVLKKINSAQINEDERQKRLFYAELYVGLDDFVEGRTESARTHLKAAAANAWGKNAGGGPGWMWHVARVHADLLEHGPVAKPRSGLGEKSPATK